jgi:hypothetical protein
LGRTPRTHGTSESQAHTDYPGRPRTLRPLDVKAAATPRARARQWREMLTDALARHEAISVPSTVIDHLRRTLCSLASYGWVCVERRDLTESIAESPRDGRWS